MMLEHLLTEEKTDKMDKWLKALAILIMFRWLALKEVE